MTPMLPEPPTTEGSDDLKATLWAALTDGRSTLWAYKQLCTAAHTLPDPAIWSDRFAEEPAEVLLHNMRWESVHTAITSLYRHADPSDRPALQSSVNASLRRTGSRLVMRGGAFLRADEEGFELGLDDSDIKSLLTGKYAPVASQYRKAVEKLEETPPDSEGAVGDALNALEGVAKIRTGSAKGTLADVVRELFPNGGGYHRPLRDAITKLYAFSNELPGSRHGRYAEPKIEELEAAFVVRITGAYIALIVGEDRVLTSTEQMPETPA